MSDNINFDDIRRQVDIVQVINTYVPLSRHGKGYVGVCPFHNDSNPSLQVSQDKQIYKCFSCGEAGNVFTFVQNYEKISFIDAVRKVCDIAGIKVQGLEKKPVVKKENAFEDKIRKLLADLTSFYSYQLKVESGREAFEYLASRGIDENICSTFKIGYAPADGHQIVKYLVGKGYSLDEIITSGVGVDIGHDEVVDRLRGRVIFPLFDSYGRVIAYSGRRLKDSDSEQKYVNTPETLLFHKSSVLYNYHNAAKYAKKEGTCYIVEGFMDAIALNRVGINGVVATMGTAFTSEHIQMLRSLNCEIRLFFDSDNAGLTATHRALKLLGDSKLKIRVVKPLKGGKDIDELLKNNGKEAVITSINDTYSAMDFELYYLGKRYNLDNHDEAKKYVQDASEFINNHNFDAFDNEHYIELISDNSGFSKELIKREINAKAKDYRYEEVVSSPTIRTRRQSRNLNKYEQADHQIIQLLLEDELNIIKYEEMGIYLYSKVCRDIASVILDKYYKNEKVALKTGKRVELADLYTDFTPEMIKTMEEIQREQYPPADIDSLSKIVMDDFHNEQHEEILERKILEEKDAKAQAQIALELIKARKSKQRIKEDKD